MSDNQNLIPIEIDGKAVEVPAGSMVMDAAAKLGLYVPHFCYHHKLSIAANCRMCLVEVEKAPKPLPACATPVTPGMKVSVTSEKARMAQKGVMEFLLINHPLDCPICDQGGECQLQDLAVGYGPSASRFGEEKRVVFQKSIGPLVSAAEMSRCIHCTRCVRFGQEIAGVMELGMAGRGEHSEIMSFVGEAVESELSGNMIDICPVGALTSKPFRYRARTWELTRRHTISLHDAVGANLVAQSKNKEVLRVVPQTNEQVNECWISDRDRFAYEGLSHADRLLEPMVRDAQGRWQAASWPDALNEAARLLRKAAELGPQRVRGIASPMATVEELGLLGRLVRGLRSESVDARPSLQQAGFDADRSGVPHLGLELEELSALGAVLVIGSSLRSELPLVAQRLRQAARRGAQVSTLHAYAEDLLMPTQAQIVVQPSGWAAAVSALGSADASPEGRAVVESLQAAASDGRGAAVLVGADAFAHPQASAILAAAQNLAERTGARLGLMPAGGNAVGAYLAQAVPGPGGRSMAEMFNDADACFVSLHLEPGLDLAAGPAAVATLQSAVASGTGVVALTAYKSAVSDCASVMLPIAPFTETSGSQVNLSGRLQSFQAVVPPQGQCRPAWKVLRVLGNLCDVAGFEFESSEAVREALLPGAVVGERLPGLLCRFVASSASSAVAGSAAKASASGAAGLERVAPLAIYSSDAIVRRAESLAATRQGQCPEARVSPATAQALGLVSGGWVRVSTVGTQGRHGEALVGLVVDAKVAPNTVVLPTGHASLAGLAAELPVAIEAASVMKDVVNG